MATAEQIETEGACLSAFSSAMKEVRDIGVIA